MHVNVKNILIFRGKFYRQLQGSYGKHCRISFDTLLSILWENNLNLVHKLSFTKVIGMIYLLI
jgi:hypothetical protein